MRPTSLRRLASLAIPLLAASILAPAAWGLDITWVYPLPDSLVTESPVTLLGYLNGDPVKALRVEVRPEDPGAAVTNQDLFLFKGRVFSAAVELTPGRNGLTVGDQFLSVLYRPGFSGAREAEFERVVPHADVTRSCSPCHTFTAGEITLARPVPELCISCHAAAAQWVREDGDSGHARGANRACSRCHEPHASRGKGFLRAFTTELCAACHQAQAAGAASHPAFEESGCTACHLPHPTGNASHLRRSAAELCGNCHEQGAGADRASLHPPLAGERPCAACHDPHGTAQRLLSSTPEELCAGCHPRILEAGHGRELEECSRCHDPHGKKGSRLLKGDVGAACAECHDNVGAGMHRHAALEEGCETCHDPHASGTDGARASCGECHDVAGDEELASLHGRLPVPAQDCTNCHQPHASDQAALLRARPHFPLLKGMCKACHGEGEQRSLAVKGTADRCRGCHPFEKEMEAKGIPRHDPVSSGDCTACHAPHASNQHRLLRDAEPKVCGECHDLPGPGEGRVVHAAEACSDCHAPHGGSRARFLKEATPALCFGCHDDPAASGEPVHPALDEGCLSCHDPHGGWGPGSLERAPVATCLECHDDPGAGLAVRHGAAAKACSGCHEPHASAGEHFLRAKGAELCRRCHEVAKPGAGIAVHPPAEEDCADCHEGTGHGGARPKLLTQSPPGLCLDCHDDPGSGGRVRHPALDEGCLVCHGAHRGAAPGMLRGDSPRAACLECHDDPAAGSRVAHRPVSEGCAACHEPHAGENLRLLRKTGNGLCQGCHTLPTQHHALGAAQGVARFPKAADFATDGPQFACIGCHPPHGAGEEGLVRPRDTLCRACHTF